MVDPQAVLAEHVQAAMGSAFGPEHAHRDPVIRPSSHADFQANAALALAKVVGLPPREVAARIVEHLQVSHVCRDVAVSGPGFVNLTLREDWLAARVAEVGADPRRGVPVQPRQVIPIDYSAPNVAKEMHVGHLRTTIVGDALARVLEHLGHHVVRQNHIGDWGTPFGMLIEHLLDVGEDSPEAGLLTSDPNAFYQAARARFDASPDVADRARRRVVLLQGGDPDTLRLWRELVQRSTAVLQHRLRDPRGHPDRRGPGRGEHVQRPARRDLRRAGAGRAGRGQRRRAVRVPRGLHRARGPAGAADHPQERRRLRLRHDRPGHHPPPRPAAARRPGAVRHRRPAEPAPADGVGDRPAGRLAAA